MITTMRLTTFIGPLIGSALSLCLSLICTPMSAATEYVAKSGTDSVTCGTLTSPCKTIQYTVSNRASSGDTVDVATGTYSEHVSISIPLTLLGSGVSKTFIDGSNRGIVVTIGSTVTVAELTIQHGNTINCGGGLVNNSTVTLFRVTITGNTANGGDIGEGVGGGVCNNGNMAIIESTISGNNGEEAGGIYNLGNGLVIAQSTISGNSTLSFGAGIESFGPTAITNSTIADNAAIFGGGIENHYLLDIYNSTITGNSSQVGGGIDNELVSGPQTVTLWNTILSGNSGTNGPSDCSGSTLTSDDYNQIGSTSGCSITLAPHDVVGANLLLGPLQNNGGPTSTILPMPGSPAIDGGNPAGCVGPNGQILKVDQRLASRGSPCDVGSVEVQGQ